MKPAFPQLAATPTLEHSENCTVFSTASRTCRCLELVPRARGASAPSCAPRGPESHLCALAHLRSAAGLGPPFRASSGTLWSLSRFVQRFHPPTTLPRPAWTCFPVPLLLPLVLPSIGLPCLRPSALSVSGPRQALVSRAGLEAAAPGPSRPRMPPEGACLEGAGPGVAAGPASLPPERRGPPPASSPQLAVSAPCQSLRGRCAAVDPGLSRGLRATWRARPPRPPLGHAASRAPPAPRAVARPAQRSVQRSVQTAPREPKMPATRGTGTQRTKARPRTKATQRMEATQRTKARPRMEARPRTAEERAWRTAMQMPSSLRLRSTRDVRRPGNCPGRRRCLPAIPARPPPRPRARA